MYIIKHYWKLKFSMLYMSHINTISGYNNTSACLDKVDVLYSEDRNVLYRLVLKNKAATMFFLEKPFPVKEFIPNIEWYGLYSFCAGAPRWQQGVESPRDVLTDMADANQTAPRTDNIFHP